jgi:hypothetical protein
MPLRCRLESFFKSVEEDSEELLSIFLDGCVGRISIKVLKREAELYGIIGLLL